MDLPSGKHSQFAIEAMAIEIVDLPINSMVIFHRFFVCLLEGTLIDYSLRIMRS